jgi:transglutaminase/protease-like cytokinesis protein 3
MVAKLGPLNTFNIATITDTITELFSNKQSKTRAIFFWIANHISIDPKTTKSNDKKNSDPVTVMQKRSTSPLGFSLLFQEMCSQANIRCLSVDGYVRRNAEECNDAPDEPNHSWNVVQLGNSPSEWFYVDVAMAAGTLDKKISVFTPRFNDQYFFPDKRIFNWQHHPDNPAWLLGQGPKSTKELFSIPLVHPSAFEFDLFRFSPLSGLIKTNTEKKNRFSFSIGKETDEPVFVVIGEGNKKSKPERVNITQNGNEFSFEYQFKKSDSYPFTIMIGTTELLSWQVEVD